MSLPVSLHFFKPAALVMAMAAVMPAIAQEQIQIPGMNMPVAASTQPQAFAKPTPSPESVPERQEDPQEEKKPRLVAITPGSAENPSVPASVVKKPTPVQPVESRQDVVVASGTNTLIPISRGQINRLVTPFDNPHIQTVSEAEISTSGNVIYVTTQDEKPVTMFVTPEDDESVAISLTLLPQGVPPIQANLILAKNVQGLASGMPITSSTNYSGQARKWERSQPYMDTLRSLMREMALGKLPRGYSFGALTSGNKIPACAQPSLSFDFSKSQLIEGHDFRVFVATAENVSARTVEFDHGSCTHPHRAAVSAWPDEVLEPGQKTEVFVVTRVPTEVPQSSTRPSLLQ
ncbi:MULTISPECIES: type-F conjugative transfer system secretin TraK [Pseudomonadaceae]|jgi:conjugal transfer pilus assembly protein TraK|uniref:type-F conjugative transfer system secretin TraK n=1 Tax=Pseudomonadaceae TaxID=135621 RepID=UPI0008BFC130|nr:MULTISPECIES: type-F conjugative transfer system secretin TraK [Pseudomonas]OHC26014.1 MAG: conjugal transfer protein [Pseudomonadales bacterium RIFCSPLOWO2_02_FULL_63_210]MDD2028514.1 type-F conjugative transfer system secretin TraK [Pseudomonas putida]PMZ92943.1 conjugal transfer protein [Pseudomonas sp. FW215-T2]PNB39375.1 conjugal transfer protein [Pseudomonas sp. FW305-131]HDS1768003.1 type-F conjugative transfer system secretin TraK [Pseudomonas putida]